MHEYYEVNPSVAQLIFAIASYGMAAGVIYWYLQPPQLMVTCLATSGLLAMAESRSLIRQENIILKVPEHESWIEVEQGGQPYFYNKYKVYQTRWFAILKLIDERDSRTLILNPDCFNSTLTYQRLRFSLLKKERRKVEARNAA